MADWVWVESPGTSLEETPRVRTAKFGDGYEQRALDGLNAVEQRWPLQFNDVDNAIADEMIAFLRTHSGVTAFDYVPLWATVAIRVICRSWRRSQGSQYGVSSISATFEQVFEP